MGKLARDPESREQRERAEQPPCGQEEALSPEPDEQEFSEEFPAELVPELARNLGRLQALREELSRLPTRPGVYLMKNAAGEVIYVGKATSLRNRVRSYFQSGRAHPPRTRRMVANIASIDYVVTDSEVEALILESNLIKEYSPRFNVRLKDDKHYPYLRVSLEEPFPRLSIVRRAKPDGARYFGPFPHAGAVRETITLLRKYFPIRTCRLPIDENTRLRPCLEYHIHRCPGPCAGLIDRQGYGEMIRQVILFLEGRQDQIIAELRREMEQAAADLQFERAAALRDRIQALQQVVEKQKIVTHDLADRDAVALAVDTGLDLACVQVFFVRGGKIVGREHFLVEEANGTPPEEIMSGFVQQYYRDATFVPPQILLQYPVESPAVVEEWLARRRGGAVHIHVPQRGEKADLMAMVAENARLTLKEIADQRDLEARRISEGLAELQRELGLERLPVRIEAFDISNTQGAESVASMVVLEGGHPQPSEYRRFRIKTVEGPNDFASMQEVVRRRFQHGLEERAILQEQGRLEGQDDTPAPQGPREGAAESGPEPGPAPQLPEAWASRRRPRFARFPDLVLIDGGRGQLNAALAGMAEAGVRVPILGLAKQFEEIYLPDRPQPLRLSPHSPALYLLQQVRDEAHRFAITYHRRLRGKRAVKSFLDDVPGIGPKRKKELLKRFGSVRRMAQASIEELAAVPGMSRKLAEALWERCVKEYPAEGGAASARRPGAAGPEAAGAPPPDAATAAEASTAGVPSGSTR